MSDIYVVLVICLLIWGGIFFYLLKQDSLLKKIERKVNFDEEIS